MGVDLRSLGKVRKMGVKEHLLHSIAPAEAFIRQLANQIGDGTAAGPQPRKKTIFIFDVPQT